MYGSLRGPLCGTQVPFPQDFDVDYDAIKGIKGSKFTAVGMTVTDKLR